MDLIQYFPYKLGTSFEENKFDLEYIQTLKTGNRFYRSFRYSEIYLPGIISSVLSYLHFKNDVLVSMDYRMDIKYFYQLIELFETEMNIGFVKDPYSDYLYYMGSDSDYIKNNIKPNKDYYSVHISELTDDFLIVNIRHVN